MRYWLAVISVILPVSFMSPVLAASQRDWNDCNQTRDPDRSIFTCTRIIRGKGETAQSRSFAYTDRGIAYEAKGDFDRAIADYDAAIRLDPKLARTYYDRGNAYDDKGDYDRAIGDYDEAIRFDPKLAKAYDNRGYAYNARGDLDRAIADHNEAIRLDPKFANAYNNCGNAYRAKGNHDHAIADHNEAIRLDPKNAKAYLSRGFAYLYSGSLARAQADVKQASELASKNAYAALWLDLAERRNNIPSHLAQDATQLDMKAWPAPVIRLFLGELTPTAVLAAADDPNPKKKQARVCDANFFQRRAGAFAGLETGGGAPLPDRGGRLPEKFRRMGCS